MRGMAKLSTPVDIATGSCVGSKISILPFKQAYTTLGGVEETRVHHVNPPPIATTLDSRGYLGVMHSDQISRHRGTQLSARLPIDHPYLGLTDTQCND